MDFLDPRLRRSYNKRLVVGYVLLTLLISLVSLILVYGVYGYGINTKTGQIIQNGLLFADSQPHGAEIYLNGQDYKTSTASRTILPAGNYSLTLKKSGYRDWQRGFTLDDHSIARFSYPLLFPVKPVVSTLKAYSQMPPLITQSPDRRWLLLQSPAGGFDEYDTNDLTKAPVNVSLPTSLMNDSGASTQFELVEWASDNTHVLLRHTLANGSEYIVLSRDKPSDSINVNSLLDVSPSQVYLRNQKFNQVFIIDPLTASVREADLGAAKLGPTILSHVLSFKPFSANLASYVTDQNVPSGKVEFRIWDNGKTFRLLDLAPSDNYFLDAGQFSGHWYYLVGDSAEARIDIYKDPLASLEATPSSNPQPLTALNLAGAQKADFSSGSRFAEAQKGSTFSVFDLDYQKTYSYTLPLSLGAPLRWLDGAHLVGQAGGQMLVMDYDSLNQQAASVTSESDGGYLSRDLNHMLTVAANDQTGTYQLLNIDMRAGSDLPKQAQ